MNVKEANVVKQAIMNEIEGYEFYKMSAKTVTDKELAVTLMNIANEEVQHAEWLQQYYNTELSDEKARINFEGLKMPESPGIFKLDEINKESLGLSVSIFKIAMQMEQDSIAYYSKAKSETTSEDASKLYDILIHWETEHLKQFEQAYSAVKEDWWSEQHFSPF